MGEIFMQTPSLAAMSVISLLLMIFAVIYRKNNVGRTVLYMLGVTGSVGCVIYSLLLGATLTDMLCFVLIFAIVSVCAFIDPERSNDRVMRHEDSEDDGDEL